MINSYLFACAVILICVLYITFFVAGWFRYRRHKGVCETIIMVLFLIVFLMTLVASPIFVSRFEDEAKTQITAEKTIGSKNHTIIECKQCANGVFVTYYNDLNQKEGIFLDNYIIEYAEEPSLEIRDVQITEKKVWKCFCNTEVERKTRYVVYLES